MFGMVINDQLGLAWHARLSSPTEPLQKLSSSAPSDLSLVRLLFRPPATLISGHQALRDCAQTRLSD
ncbi:hypothetical protein CEXT_739211, partial [Caerostris extrusa]